MVIPCVSPYKELMKPLWLPLVLLCLVLGTPGHAQSEYASDPFDPEVAKDAWTLISNAEKAYDIPPGLLHAMSLVETGQGVRGWVLPWPYTVGVNSPGSHSYAGRAAAVAAYSKWRNLGFVRFDIRAPGVVKYNVSAKDAQAVLLSLSESAPVVMEARNFGRRFKSADEATAFATRMIVSGYNNLDLGMMQVNWKVHGKHFSSVRSAFTPTHNLQYAVSYLLQHRQTRDWWGSVGRYHSGTAKFANKYIKNVYSMYLRIHRVTTTLASNA